MEYPSTDWGERLCYLEAVKQALIYEHNQKASLLHAGYISETEFRAFQSGWFGSRIKVVHQEQIKQRELLADSRTATVEEVISFLTGGEHG